MKQLDHGAGQRDRGIDTPWHSRQQSWMRAAALSWVGNGNGNGQGCRCWTIPRADLDRRTVQCFHVPVIDEDPSPEDVERFSSETAYCPWCGAEIWDQAERCPQCGDAVGGQTISRPPLEHWWRRRWLILIVVAALLAFLLMVIGGI